MTFKNKTIILLFSTPIAWIMFAADCQSIGISQEFSTESVVLKANTSVFTPPFQRIFISKYLQEFSGNELPII